MYQIMKMLDTPNHKARRVLMHLLWWLGATVGKEIGVAVGDKVGATVGDDIGADNHGADDVAVGTDPPSLTEYDCDCMDGLTGKQ